MLYFGCFILFGSVNSYSFEVIKVAEYQTIRFRNQWIISLEAAAIYFCKQLFHDTKQLSFRKDAERKNEKTLVTFFSLFSRLLSFNHYFSRLIPQNRVI